MNEEFNMERFQEINQLVQFNYNNPYPNFNRSQVLGRVAALFTVKEPEKYCLALQILAGWMTLQQVVVTTQDVAKDLIKGRVVQQRVTYMPLNKLETRSLPRNVVDSIEKKSGGKAKLAIDLI